ncbi:MAG: hypothetical protein GX620_08415, partial [Chloroflexi bacterium]|nr:hypothetical protein [Chloroflexota bacterium]
MMNTDNTSSVESEAPARQGQEPQFVVELSPAERKARRILIIGLVAAGLLLIGLIVLLVFLSIDAYQAAYAGVGPSPGSVVVGVLRDSAIIFVAFETLI